MKSKKNFTVSILKPVQYPYKIVSQTIASDVDTIRIKLKSFLERKRITKNMVFLSHPTKWVEEVDLRPSFVKIAITFSKYYKRNLTSIVQFVISPLQQSWAYRYQSPTQPGKFRSQFDKVKLCRITMVKFYVFVSAQMSFISALQCDFCFCSIMAHVNYVKKGLMSFSSLSWCRGQLLTKIPFASSFQVLTTTTRKWHGSFIACSWKENVSLGEQLYEPKC